LVLGEEILRDWLLTLFCYVYILSLIFISGKMEGLLHISKRASRKFLHAMIGNLPLIVPFFASTIYPILIAASFILITFLASPHSPFKISRFGFRGLSELTEEGHTSGPLFYAISYTFLALFFASKPHIMAAGILPMAYGDCAAWMVGERYGRRMYSLFAEKSFEGTAAMFLANFLSCTLSLLYFSALYPLPIPDRIPLALAVAVVATFVEGVSPVGFDNLTVPVSAALTFLLLGGGV
jgi:phytol kinase